MYILLCITVKTKDITTNVHKSLPMSLKKKILNKSLPVSIKALSHDFILTGGKPLNKTGNSAQGEKEGNAEEKNYGFYLFWKPQHSNLKELQKY